MLLEGCHHVFLWLFLVVLRHFSKCSNPLHLTPFLDKGDITTALELSQVRDPNNIIPKSYAGFITVDRHLGNHLFFWFCPAISDPQAPVLVWLNGGPTISSMYGLLLENGPIRVTQDKTGKVSYIRWSKSWAESLSMLYIDNPVGTGYSYSDSKERGWKTTIDGYTEDLFSFVNQFYLLFPDHLKYELYIGGQSYAGKFVPSLAYRIHKEIQANRSSLPLAGIYLGGPYFDPYTQSLAQGQFYYSLGAVSYAQFMYHRSRVRAIFEGNFTTHNKTFSSIFGDLAGVSGYVRDNYFTGENPQYWLVDIFMNKPRVRELVHVGSQGRFQAINEKLNAKYASDLLVSTKPQMAEIMNNYKVLIFSGDFDGIVTTATIEEAILSIPWSLQAQYNESDRSLWFVDKNLTGFYTQTGKFCRVIIYRAGHQTPYDQPDATREMMLRFVRHGCIQTNQAGVSRPTGSGKSLNQLTENVLVLLTAILTWKALVSLPGL